MEWVDGWNRPGGDLGDDARARVFLPGAIRDEPDQGIRAVDLTSVVKSARDSGTFGNGFIVIPAPGERDGLDALESRMWDRLAEATLVVSYKLTGRTPLAVGLEERLER